MAYKSILRPKIEYAAPIWDPYMKDNIQLLQSSPPRMHQIQQTRECHEHAAGPGLAIAGTETNRIPPNVVPSESPQRSQRGRECTDGTKSQSLAQRKQCSV